MYKTIPLSENQYTTCPHCGGTNRVYMQGDLHKSSGWIPCNFNICVGGTLKYREEHTYFIVDENGKNVKIVDDKDENGISYIVKHVTFKEYRKIGKSKQVQRIDSEGMVTGEFDYHDKPFKVN